MRSEREITCIASEDVVGKKNVTVVVDGQLSESFQNFEMRCKVSNHDRVLMI